MEAESSNATVSGNPTRPVAPGSSCSFSWKLRCLLDSFRTRSCAREADEVSSSSLTFTADCHSFREPVVRLAGGDCFDVGLIKPTPIWTRLKRIKNVLKSYVCTQIWSVTNSYNPALWLDLEESRYALTYNGVAGRTMWTRSCKHQNNSPEFIWVILYSF